VSTTVVTQNDIRNGMVTANVGAGKDVEKSRLTETVPKD